MHADSYFEQGHQHKVCQDYAAHDETDDLIYAVVADGCSASPKTDFGARIIAESFIEAVKSAERLDFLKEENERQEWYDSFEHFVPDYTLKSMRAVSKVLNLGHRPLEATLVAAVYVKRQNALHLYMWGDGSIHLKSSDRHVWYGGLYLTNAPYYLAYNLHPDLRAGYIQEFGEPNDVYSKTVRDQNGDVIERTKLGGERMYVKFQDFEIKDLDFALVTSDGFESYRTPDDKFTPMLEGFLNFKSFEGEFVQRRMQKLRSTNAKKSITHYDDISSAAIYLK